MKSLALCLVFAASLISGVAQAEPDAVTKTTLKLVKQFNAKFVVSGVEFDGSAVECVAGIKNIANARTAASNRARATCAFAQGNNGVRQVVVKLGGTVMPQATLDGIKKKIDEKTITTTFEEAVSSLIEANEYQVEGDVVCARAHSLQ